MKPRTTKSQSCSYHRLATVFAAATLLLFANTAHAGVTVSNRVVTTFRNVITVDDTGLPAQIEIRALTNDLPLAWRAEKERPATLIKRIGRGPQLAVPMRLEAVIDKAMFVVKADAPAELVKTDKGLEATGTWQADKLKGRLRIVYAEDGSMTGQVTYDAKGTDLERLDMVMEIDGPVDTAVAGNPVVFSKDAALPLEYGTLGSKHGMLWLNGKNPEGDGKLQKGLVSHFFLGNGDRGFTWLAGEGLVLDKDAPSMSVELSREKVTQWKIALVNKSPRSGEKTANFTFLIHPARAKVTDCRLTQWQPWSEKAATPALDVAARGALVGTNMLVRAEGGSVYEVAATRALLEGVAGGETLAAGTTLADRFPLGLFRYLASPHTALAAQLRPNAAALSAPSAAPAPDRMALGRALLHDIGVDLNGLADRVGAAEVVRALEEFGYFERDGQTEFLPYWRTEGIFQFGEDFEADADRGFAVTTESPTARTKVSAFIRSAGAENTAYTGVKNRRKTIFVLVNEGPKAVREFLLIQNPLYLFGGPNRVQAEQIYSQLDFSCLAADGDWNRCRLERSMPETYPRGGPFQNAGNRVVYRAYMSELMDLETGGFVRIGKTQGKPRGKFAGDNFLKNGWQIYGPVYVPARGMRLLYGAGAMVLPHGIAGRVYDRQTGKPLSVPVHVFSGTFSESETPAADKDRRLLVTVQADKDGRFRCPGISGGTVVAEVAGKMVPAQPQRTIGNYEPWEGTVGGGAWPSFDLGKGVVFPDNGFGAAGKWLDVLIAVDAPPAP